MKNLTFKNILPHLIAIGVFLIAALLIGKTGLDGSLVLRQSDTTHWQAMSQQAMLYKEAHGHFPLWITNLFSGMPAYQVALEGPWNPMSFSANIMSLWLPQPMNFFFLACICFYIMTQCIGMRPWAGIFGALSFAFCSYNPIIITAGHVTKMLAMAYAPAVIGGVILILKRKYLLGFALTAFFTTLQIAPGHQQVSYYLFLVLGLMCLSSIIYNMKRGETSHLIKSLGLVAVAGLLGVGANAITLFPTYDYAKESKRGGQLVMDGNNKTHEKVENGRTTGLSKDYAFQWSYGKGETFTLMFPGVMGYGVHQGERDGEVYMFPMLDDNSNTLKTVNENLPPQAADQLKYMLSSRLYWGDQPFTNGPVYLGAIVCMLFMLGLFYVDAKWKWWILAASVLGIILAWGSNFSAFNYFLFDHFPLYNKFRVPTMALIIPQWLAPLMGALYLDKLVGNHDSSEEKLAAFKKGMMTVGALVLLALAFYFMADFSNPTSDKSLIDQFTQMLQGAPDATGLAKRIVNGLMADRKSLFMGDIIRTVIFIALAATALWFYMKDKINGTVLLAGITLLSFIDLYLIANKYLNDKSYGYKEDSEFVMTNADKEILKDTDPNYRVFDMTGGDPFQDAKPSYYHKSIGGYHAAKLGIYDDLMNNAFTTPEGRLNMGIINMLNTKYIVQKQGNDAVAMKNPEALGNAWFVKTVVNADGPVEAVKQMKSLNTKDSAVIDKVDAAKIAGISAVDSASGIKQTAFDNDAISYESNSSTTGFAVFSEVYYKDWNAYIDGKKQEIIRTNYILRGLVVPAGKHKIDFKFEPKVYNTSKTIYTAANWVLFISLIGALGWVLFGKRKD